MADAAGAGCNTVGAADSCSVAAAERLGGGGDYSAGGQRLEIIYNISLTRPRRDAVQEINFDGARPQFLVGIS